MGEQTEGISGYKWSDEENREGGALIREEEEDTHKRG